MANTSSNNENNHQLKDPQDWVTGNEPATESQMAFLKTLAERTGETLSEKQMTKSEAAEKIDALQQQTPSTSSDAIKDPATWTTGAEPATESQKSYLTTLATEAGMEIDMNLTKSEASEKIEELQQKTGRGTEGAEGKA